MRTIPQPSASKSTAPAPRRAYHPTRAEQETIFRWDREDDQVHVWIASPTTWRKLERLGVAPIRETRFPGGAVADRSYRIPLARFRWGLKRVVAKGPGRRVTVRTAA